MLRFTDGFDSYGIGAGSSCVGLDRKWATVVLQANMASMPGRFSGYSARFQNADCVLKSPALTTDDTLIVGLAFNMYSAAQDTPFLTFYDGATAGVNVRFVTSGSKLEVRRGTTQLAITGTLTITTGEWHYLELKVKCHATEGTYEVRLDGVSQLSGTEVNTQEGAHAYHDAFQLAIASGNPVYFDDVYACDGSGATNNGLLGVMRIQTLMPSADTAVADWTPNSGADHFNRVNENPADDDTSYLTGESGDVDLFDLTNMANGPGHSIKGITVNSVIKRTDDSITTVKLPVKSGATTSDGSSLPVGTSYGMVSRVLETDPNTSEAWTRAAIAAMQAGLKA